MNLFEVVFTSVLFRKDGQ